MSKLAEEQAYNRIKEMIVRAELKPGTPLVHRKLAKELGMSPVPVVLALRLLEQNGLVVNIPGLGASVRTWNRQELIDLFDIRASLEAQAARLCATRATRGDLGNILTAAEENMAAVARENFEDVHRTDVEFHRCLVQGAHCPYLENLLGNLSLISLSINMLLCALQAPVFDLPNAPVIVHENIIAALEKRDPEAAAEAAVAHVQESLAANIAWYDANAEAMAPYGEMHG